MDHQRQGDRGCFVNRVCIALGRDDRRESLGFSHSHRLGFFDLGCKHDDGLSLLGLACGRFCLSWFDRRHRLQNRRFNRSHHLRRVLFGDHRQNGFRLFFHHHCCDRFFFRFLHHSHRTDNFGLRFGLSGL